MTYNEYFNLCQRFRTEIVGVKEKTPTQRRKAVDLMKLAKSMGDFRSSTAIVGCSHDSMKRWRMIYTHDPCTGAVVGGVRCLAGGIR